MVTCTACGIDLDPTSDQYTSHYTSEWHTYNLKRQLVGLRPVPEQMYLQSIKDLQDTPKTQEKKSAHVKSTKKDKYEQRLAAKASGQPQKKTPEQLEAEANKYAIEYKPTFCLFENKIASSLEANLAYMKRKHNFELFEPEYIVDIPALITYLGEKIWLGAQCIYCNKGFGTREAVWSHMKDMSHCRVDIYNEEIMGELDGFYDYSKSYEKFEQEIAQKFAHRQAKTLEDDPKKKKTLAITADNKNNMHDHVHDQGETAADDDDDEWEDESGSEDESSDAGADSAGRSVENILEKYNLEPVRINDGYLRLMDGREVPSRHAANILKQRPGDLTHIQDRYANVVEIQRKRVGLRERLLALTDGREYYGGNRGGVRSEEEMKMAVERSKKEAHKAAKLGVVTSGLPRPTPDYHIRLM